MAIYSAVGDAPKVKGGKRRGVDVAVYENQVLSAGPGTLTLVTSLSKVLAVDVLANEAAIEAAGLGTSTFTWTAVANVVTVFGWRPTGAGNPTLIAANTATPISVVVYGLYNLTY